MSRADRIVDARGLRCPLPVIRLAAVARDARPGELLTVLATDPAVRYDVPAWARMRGHAVVESSESPESSQTTERTWAITVRVGG